jgi:site-specific recombinase XerD
MSSQKKTSFSLLFYPSKTKLKKNGEAPVLMKININGNRIVLNTKRSVIPSAWNSVKGRMGGRTQEAKEFNDYIDAIILRTRQKYSELLTQHDVVTPEMLRDAVLGVHTAQARMLLDIFEEHIENMRRLIGKETTKATCQKYGTCKAHLQKFLKVEYRASDIPVKSVDYYFVDKFGLYLKTTAGCATNTSIKFLQNFKKIILLCMRNGWLQKDPFANINLSLKEVDRPYLNKEELTRLEEFSTPIDRLNRVRDFFVFSCYTGLAYADVKKLKRSEIERSEDRWWIRTKRQKTGGMTNVPLLQKPVQILLKYSDFEFLQDDDPVLPMLSNQKMNAYLKELADLCGITKPLSFHTARHTFATTVTMMNGVPMESVSKMLGHKNLKSTQHYARIVDQKVGRDMEQLALILDGKLKQTAG